MPIGQMPTEQTAAGRRWHGPPPASASQAHTSEIRKRLRERDLHRGPSPMTPSLRLVVEQTAPQRGEVERNRVDIQRALNALEGPTPGPVLVSFPELALTGYSLGSRTSELALPTTDPPPVRPPSGITAILGFPERAQDGRIYNAAAAVRGGRWVHRYRKCFLPTYGTFDEGRYFAPSRRGPEVFEAAPGWRVATLVCEDLWHPSLTYLAALRGADLVVVPTAVPGRGVVEGGAGPAFQSMERWVAMATALASFHQLWVVVVNRAGVEGGLTFAGGSFVVAPDGAVAARLDAAADRRIDLELDPGATAAARRLYSHRRDEDGTLLLRELERTLRPDRAASD